MARFVNVELFNEFHFMNSTVFSNLIIQNCRFYKRPIPSVYVIDGLFFNGFVDIAI